MTAPRQIVPGASYIISRRCSERRFFLKPSKKVSDIFLYSLGVYSQRYGILVHGYVVLSNHYHVEVTDPRGRLPDFQRDFDAVVARAMNQALHRTQALWDRDSYSAVRLVTPDDVFRKLLYALANPVEAGLVRHASDWPGVWSDPDSIGGPPMTIRRPEGFFDEDGDMPEVVQLQLTPPPQFQDEAGFAQRVREALREVEAETAARFEQEGRRFLGVAEVLSQNPFAGPKTQERLGGLNPRVACRSKWKRIEALLRLKEFVRAHRDALLAWRSGARDVLFPAGTWHMCVHHAARCESYG